MHFSMTDDLLEATLLGWSVRSVLWTFFLSGLLGTVIETIYCAAKWGVLECRNGVVHMPFGPIYGLAGTAMTLALTPLMGHLILAFLAAIVVGTAVEYVAGRFLQRLHLRFWDYSDEPFNLRGLICLRYAVAWGGLGVLLVLTMRESLDWIDAVVPRAPADAFLTVLLLAYLLCAALTVPALVRLDRRVVNLRAERDGGAPPYDLAAPGWRLVDTLVTERTLVYTYPHLDRVIEYCDLTGCREYRIALTPTARARAAEWRGPRPSSSLPALPAGRTV